MEKLIRIVFFPLFLLDKVLDPFFRKHIYRRCPHCEDGRLHSRSSDANYSAFPGCSSITYTCDRCGRASIDSF
jgi:hypothetical protein